MDQQFNNKIKEILAELKANCILKASDFDKACKVANTFSEAKGPKWNKYTHKYSGKFGFEIWKNEDNENFYVNTQKECAVKAEAMGLSPFTNKKLYRGVAR